VSTKGPTVTPRCVSRNAHASNDSRDDIAGSAAAYPRKDFVQGQRPASLENPDTLPKELVFLGDLHGDVLHDHHVECPILKWECEGAPLGKLHLAL
jgi:hypothetical protein